MLHTTTGLPKSRSNNYGLRTSRTMRQNKIQHFSSFTVYLSQLSGLSNRKLTNTNTSLLLLSRRYPILYVLPSKLNILLLYLKKIIYFSLGLSQYNILKGSLPQGISNVSFYACYQSVIYPLGPILLT